jgi:uncharacterized protein DUF928
MTNRFMPGRGMVICAVVFAGMAHFGQNPPTGQEKPVEKKPPVKRVRVDMAGFELGQAAPPKSSTQLGGGTRAMGGDTVLLAPVVGRCYTATPVVAWTHTAQVQNFEFRLFDPVGKLVHRMRVPARQLTFPADVHPLGPGTTFQWSVQPENAMLGGPSAKATIRRLTAAELDEVAQQLNETSPNGADSQEWKAQVFTDRRLWYDAIAAWSDLIQRFPTRADLREKRGQIYDQLSATQPLADEDFAAAEKLGAGRL